MIKGNTAFNNEERFFKTVDSLQLRIIADRIMYDDNPEIATYETNHVKEITSNISFDKENLEELFDINDIQGGVGEIKNCLATLEEGWESKCQLISEQEYNLFKRDNQLILLEAEKEKMLIKAEFSKNLESMEKIYNNNINEIKDFCKENGITGLEESEWDHYNTLYKSSLLPNCPECLKNFEKMYSPFNDNYLYINTELCNIKTKEKDFRKINDQIRCLKEDVDNNQMEIDEYELKEVENLETVSTIHM